MNKTKILPREIKQKKINSAPDQQNNGLTRPQFWGEVVHNANQKNNLKSSFYRFSGINHK